MQFTSSIFSELLKPIDRRAFRLSVAEHDGDRYDKSFGSWEHLVTLLFAQFSGTSSLRAIAAGLNAQSHLHYHLGCGEVAPSTLSDANARRPVAVFSDVFNRLAGALGRKTRREAKDVLHLIDATPIMLRGVIEGASSNGRIKGFKLHVRHDLDTNCPLIAEITEATINDLLPARQHAIEKGVTYVFDKAYCDYAWWQKINDRGAFFVTRPKANMNVTVIRRTPLRQVQGDGFRVLSDHIVTRGTAKQARLNATFSMPLRRIAVRRDEGGTFTIISNDMTRSAAAIAACYKARWQIELLFRWLKQNLNITRFIGRNENAVHLQIMAGLIAFVLIRIAQTMSRTTLEPKRFVELIQSFLPSRRTLATIDKPPPVNPRTPLWRTNPNQLSLALN